MRDGASSLKQPLQQLALKQPIRLGREPEAARLLLQPLLLGQLAQVILHLLLQRAELIDVARLGELGEQVHVDDADAGRLAGLFELLEQLVDLLQLFLDRQRLRHGHRLVAGELVLGRQLVDLVLVAQPLDQAAPASPANGDWSSPAAYQSRSRSRICSVCTAL